MDATGDHFGQALTRINKEAARQFAPVLETWGLAPGMQSYLLAMPVTGVVPQRDLAGRLGVDPANVSRAAHALESRGLMTRRRELGSLRNWEWELSPRGREAREAVEVVAMTLVASLADRVGVDDWPRLVGLLTRAAGM